jgi:ribosomal protein L12E/L44/L45/RPP1/RPP2
MESIYAALLLHKASQEISEASIEKVLKAAGANVDKSQITKLVAGLKETKIDDILAAAAATPVMAAAPAAGTAASGKEEAKGGAKKKKKKEEEEEEAEEEPTGIGSLF